MNTLQGGSGVLAIEHLASGALVALGPFIVGCRRPCRCRRRRCRLGKRRRLALRATDRGLLRLLPCPVPSRARSWHFSGPLLLPLRFLECQVDLHSHRLWLDPDTGHARLQPTDRASHLATERCERQSTPDLFVIRVEVRRQRCAVLSGIDLRIELWCVLC